MKLHQWYIHLTFLMYVYVLIKCGFGCRLAVHFYVFRCAIGCDLYLSETYLGFVVGGMLI